MDVTRWAGCCVVLARIEPTIRPGGRVMEIRSRLFERFTDQPTVLLTTYRRDGTPVDTPVSIVVQGDRAFFRTYERAGMMKRIRSHPDIEIRPCTFTGRPTGPPIRAHARLLSETESALPRRLLARKHPILHGILVPLGHRLRGDRTVHLELRAVDELARADPKAA
jgi:PPOX class probable F420-dependent enzyme